MVPSAEGTIYPAISKVLSIRVCCSNSATLRKDLLIRTLPNAGNDQIACFFFQSHLKPHRTPYTVKTSQHDRPVPGQIRYRKQESLRISHHLTIRAWSILTLSIFARTGRVTRYDYNLIRQHGRTP